MFQVRSAAAFLGLWLFGSISAFGQQPPASISRSDYADRLHGMWLGECIANWTGLRTEGMFIQPPFLTDADWGQDFGRGPIDFRTDLNPWFADDDTDIEYTYVHLLHTLQATRLTPQQIADGWIAHINRFIWVSNATARQLMGQGVRPPATGMGVPNGNYLMIDAQLTTEVFGALAPAMPGRGLRIGLLPMQTTSSRFALHAAQHFALLYALAPCVDQALPRREQMLWLVREARQYIPDTSKSAEIVDFVVADYLANPDVNNWELTRDNIYERYHRDAMQHGYKYIFWYESSVNFATGIMCLLYGEGDYKRTVQIGTLSGWDSDNPTATMGGLLGLLYGYDEIVNAFPGVSLSDRYDIDRTRDNLPDYLPGDFFAEDTLGMLAQRMLPIIDRVVAESGGTVDLANDRWVLPPRDHRPPLLQNPAQREWRRSANCRLRQRGFDVAASATFGPGMPGDPNGDDPAYFANGFEQDYSGREPQDTARRAYVPGPAARGIHATASLSVDYGEPVDVQTVRFIEGAHFPDGGWFQTIAVQVRIGGQWMDPPGGAIASEALDSAAPYQVIEFQFAAPLRVDGVRVSGETGGSGKYVTCCELDGLSPGGALNTAGPTFAPSP
ncbi:MAG: hypothetical protein CHACPFDD_03091 [Phycisphaerae bacterium]|nr:hypothetical protein [Phycisphaerae bacterium]